MKENACWAVFKYNGSHMAASRGNNGDITNGGDQEERFLKAFEDFSDALFRHASFRLSDREKAIDVVHDTFAKAWTYVRGGHEVASRLKELAHAAGLKGRIRINKAGCLDQCGMGVAVVIYPEAVWYGRVKPEDADEIFHEHVMQGRPVERLRIGSPGPPPAAD